MPRACFYVSGHGFGHSSRVQAVVERLLEDSNWTVEIRTSAPRWFYRWLLSESCTHTSVQLEPGVVQRDAFHHDARATLQAWEATLQQGDRFVEQEASHLDTSGCAVVISDMAPLAFAAARAAGVPSLAMGNFTWDWILEHYLDREPELASVIRQVRRLYGMADQYLRLPMSHETDVFDRQRTVDLVARRHHATAGELRQRLGLDSHHVLILLCFGGVGFSGVSLEQVPRYPGARCVWDREESLPDVLLSVSPQTHYPDLIRAADVVLTKPGYGILAEAMAGGTPVVYARRHGFRESAMLEEYLSQVQWPAAALPRARVEDGSWIKPAMALAGAPCPKVSTAGAAQVVMAIREAARGAA